MNVISIQNLFFNYQKNPVLQNVSLTVAANECLGIIGPNGGGKTTLLKLIVGLLKPTQGQILVFNQPPGMSHNKIGYVPQRLEFDQQFPISVLDVVLMGYLNKITWWGGVSSEYKDEALKTLELVGLKAYASAHFGSLSGGQAQRCLIARALVTKPKILLLDEPTSCIDTSGTKIVYDLLKNLRKDMTILIVSHNLQAMLDYADKLICLHHELQEYQVKEVCDHFKKGLYHPILNPNL